MTERIIAKKSGNIRENIHKLIKDKKIGLTDELEDIKQILLIDEVDIFFHEHYQGNTYNLLGHIDNLIITKIIKYIWNNTYTYGD